MPARKPKLPLSDNWPLWRKKAASINAQACKWALQGRISAEELRQHYVSLLPESERCYWCKRELNAKNLSVDHVVPLAKQGPHSLSNLAIVCRVCNMQKGALDPTFWAELIEFLRQRNAIATFNKQFQHRRFYRRR